MLRAGTDGILFLLSSVDMNSLTIHLLKYKSLKSLNAPFYFLTFLMTSSLFLIFLLKTSEIHIFISAPYSYLSPYPSVSSSLVTSGL